MSSFLGNIIRNTYAIENNQNNNSMNSNNNIEKLE